MSSIDRKIHQVNFTGGTFVGVGATGAYVFSNFTAPTVGPTSSVYSYTTGATQADDSALALAGLAAALGTQSNSITAGECFRDMGDRFVFMAGGEQVAVVAAVQPLDNAANEGSQNRMYLTIWNAAPAAPCVVGVARV